MKRVLHFTINIFDTKYDIYGFLSNDDYVEKPQTRDTGGREKENQQIGYHFKAGLGLMIVLENIWNNTRLKLIPETFEPLKIESFFRCFWWNFLQNLIKGSQIEAPSILWSFECSSTHNLILSWDEQSQINSKEF